MSASGTKATSLIELEYNFLIAHSNSGELHNYKVSVDLSSGIAMFQNFQRDMPKHIWRHLGYLTGRAEVEFIDYGIGQNFLNVISLWFEARTIAKRTSVLDWIQKKSHLIPIIFKYLFLIVCSTTFIGIRDRFLSDSYNNQALASFLILAFSGIFIATEIGFRMGKTIETAVDRIWKLGYIELNEGDRKLLSDVSNHNSNCFLAILYKSLAALVVSLVPKILSEILLP